MITNSERTRTISHALAQYRVYLDPVDVSFRGRASRFCCVRIPGTPYLFRCQGSTTSCQPAGVRHCSHVASVTLWSSSADLPQRPPHPQFDASSLQTNATILLDLAVGRWEARDIVPICLFAVDEGEHHGKRSIEVIVDDDRVVCTSLERYVTLSTIVREQQDSLGHSQAPACIAEVEDGEQRHRPCRAGSGETPEVRSREEK